MSRYRWLFLFGLWPLWTGAAGTGQAPPPATPASARAAAPTPAAPPTVESNRAALIARRDVSVPDLMGAWDDSLVPLIISYVEALAQNIARQGIRRAQTKTGPAETPLMNFSRLLTMLYQNPSAWAGDPTFPPRLSKAILTAYPGLAGGRMAGMEPGTQAFSNALSMLGATRDPAMIVVIRPYLSNKLVDGNGVLATQRTPLRVCEVAANAIHDLLGERRPYGGSASGLSSFPPGPYLLWEEWDKQHAALEQRLAAMAAAPAAQAPAGSGANASR